MHSVLKTAIKTDVYIFVITHMHTLSLFLNKEKQHLKQNVQNVQGHM